MIAKISTGTSLYGALAYNQDKVDDKQAKVLAANIIYQPADGQFNISDCLHEFQNWMPSHYRTKNIVMHVSLNPHPDDILSDIQLTAIGEEYMRELGYGNQPYIIFKHEDIDRHHLHIVSLRVDTEGKKINDKFEHERSKKITQQIEDKYHLHPAESKLSRQEEWQFTPIDSTKGDLKRQISNVLKPLIKMYSFQTLGEFRALLSLYNISLEEVKGEAGGKPYHGLIYSALDKQGNKVGVPLKSSLFGKLPGYASLQEQMKKNALHSKQAGAKADMKHYRDVITRAVHSSRTEDEFRRVLQVSGMDVVFRTNDSGRIYGVTFVDHDCRQVFNGSRLGKAYSANVFNDWLVNKIPPVELPMPLPNYEQPSGIPHEDFGNWQPPVQTSKEDGNALTDLFDLFSPDSSASENNAPFPRKRKKKKRRKPGQQL